MIKEFLSQQFVSFDKVEDQMLIAEQFLVVICSL